MRARLLMLTLTAALAATACVMPQASTPAPGGQTAARATALGTLQGTVKVPSRFIGNDAGSFIGNDAGSFIGNDAGSYGVLAIAQSTVPAVKVRLVDASGQPVPGVAPVVTDSKGRFTIARVPAGATYVVVADFPSAAGKRLELKTLTRPTDLGTVADLDAATTMVTTAVVADQAGGLGAFSLATFKRAVGLTAEHLNDESLPDFSDAKAVLAAMNRLAETVDGLKNDVGQLKSDLARVREELDALKEELKNRDQATPSPTPAASGTAEPTATPGPTPTPGATATPTGAAPTPASGNWVVTTLANGALTTAIRGIAVLDGHIYVADTGKHTVQRIAPDGTVTTFAGQAGLSGHVNGAREVAKLGAPVDVEVGADGSLYVTEASNNRVRRIDKATGEVSTFAGKGTTTVVDGVGTAAAFWNPRGLARLSDGTLVLAEQSSGRLRKLTADGTVSSIEAEGQPLVLDKPTEVAIDAGGTIYVAQPHLHRIMKVTPAGVASVFVGGTQGLQDGTGEAARFDQPSGLALDAEGHLLVADANNNAIRRVSPAGVVTTIAGGQYGDQDGDAASAQFKGPFDIEVEGGVIYVSDKGGQRIRVLKRS